MSTTNEKRDPRAKFVELANARVAKVIKDLRLIGNLSNRRNYEFSDDEARVLLRTLESEMEILKNKFKPQPTVVKQLFKL
jgi:hypothetical protein